jgi:magnesium chelatase accessory protein
MTMLFSPARLSLQSDGRDWPNRAASRMVSAGGLDWHVQEMGAGPKLLLLHGTGASTHSWRDVAPLLAKNFHVLMPDLPGHGFTGMPASRGLSLSGMAGLVAQLCRSLGFAPEIAIGHSSGAAVLIAGAMEAGLRPRGIVAINGALLPIRNARLLSPLAGLLFVNPVVPHLFAWRARSEVAVARVLAGTGSALDARGIALYEKLFRNPGHVAGALGMMANWNLDRLQDDLGRLDLPLVLVTAPGDKAVPPGDAAKVAALVRDGRVVMLARGGHLAHEEYPKDVCDVLIAEAARLSAR